MLYQACVLFEEALTTAARPHPHALEALVRHAVRAGRPHEAGPSDALGPGRRCSPRHRT
jgi:hypothetical protein